MNGCTQCSLYGEDYHSFKMIARSEKFGRIMYTCVARAKDYSNRRAIIGHIDSVLGKETGAWTWVFDCYGISLKHTMQLDVAVALSNLVKAKYHNDLQRIVIINPTGGVETLIKHVLPIFSPDSLQYLTRCKGGILEVYEGLKTTGFEDAVVGSLITVIREHWATAVST